MPMLAARTFLAAALVLTPCGCAVVGNGHSAVHKVLRAGAHSKSPHDDGVVKPLKFKQELLVCNAYPSNVPMTVKQNGQSTLSKDHNSISFQGCEQVASDVHTKDKLDVEFEGAGIQGTFEVGDLPDSDATLLLVVGKRDAKSPLVAFQSFAFPTRAASNAAQLAVIDTFKGDSNSPHLKMEELRSVSKEEHKKNKDRTEQLNFNRVYAVEEGSYAAEISDLLHQGNTTTLVESAFGKRTFHFTKGKNYVVLRVGDDKLFPQSLVVFPPELKSNAMMASPVGFALLVLGLTMTFM